MANINSSVGNLLKGKNIPKKTKEKYKKKEILDVTNVTSGIELPYIEIEYTDDKKINDYLNTKNKDIQKLHTTARLVLGKIFEEVNEKLAGNNRHNGLYIKWLESNGFNRMTALRHRNRYKLYQAVTTEKAKAVVATARQKEIDAVFKSDLLEVAVTTLDEGQNLVELIEGKKETVMLGEPVLQFIDLEKEFDKFVQVRGKADLKSLSEAKTKKVHRLLEEIEKIIGE